MGLKARSRVNEKAVGCSASRQWALSRGIDPHKPRWYIEVSLDVADRPAGEVYWGDKDTRFHFNVHVDEWSFLFVHRGKTSHIRVVADKPFVHGDDQFRLLGATPAVDEIDAFLRGLEAKHGIQFKREHAHIASNLAGAKVAVRTWLAAGAS